MLVGAAVKAIIKKSPLTQKTLAEKIGVKSQSVIAERLKTPNPLLMNIMEMLEPLGYEIVFRPKDPASELPSYVITTAEEGDSK